jgi:hypothetical protein
MVIQNLQAFRYCQCILCSTSAFRLLISSRQIRDYQAGLVLPKQRFGETLVSPILLSEPGCLLKTFNIDQHDHG